MPLIRLTADKEAESLSLRLDTFAASESGGTLSRSRIKAGLRSARVNGVDAKLSRLVRAGDLVEIEWEDPVPSNIIAQNIPLSILYEDKNVTVINKKQGMVTHPANGNWEGTLVNALLFHWGKTDSKQCRNNLRPGIVHRLDKDTSGIIITAKNRETEELLQRQFAERRVKKQYAAIVAGKPPAQSGEIKNAIVRNPKNRKTFTCVPAESGRGKFAWTKYRCVATLGNYSLMLLTLKTGRTHQLRVHMKHLGCPILGDPLYGKKDSYFSAATLMLHSFRLALRLPGSTEFSFFKAPLPLRFRHIVRTLKDLYEIRR